MKRVTMTCVGTRPILLHNVRLASPLNPYAKRLKALNSNRSKTDEDRIEIARVEFEGSLYYDNELGPYIPGENVTACLVEGAKIKRGGKKIERGVQVMSFQCPLLYDGPRTIEGLWNGGESEFIDIRPVTVQTSKVDRCRPIFRNWVIEVDLVVDEGVLDFAEFKTHAEQAGKYAGLGDYRKAFGRFEVSFEVTEEN